MYVLQTSVASSARVVNGQLCMSTDIDGVCHAVPREECFKQDGVRVNKTPSSGEFRTICFTRLRAPETIDHHYLCE